ncbi:MAG TPA: lamin tail domain-containing protein [Kofleriaceae bacterium]|nr:lamin tail domain-containing protein [Kofleriaceae bacterium]
MPRPAHLAISCSAWVAAAALASMLAACGPGDDSNTTSCSGLLAGDLVITEVFADYAAPPGASGADEGKEWFEIYNASTSPKDLEGVVINHSRPDGSMGKTHVMKATTIAPGQYLVLANTLPDLVPTWGDYGYGADLGDLYNQDGGKFTLMCGPTEIDHATYELVDSGTSRSLDGSHPPDYQTNDDPSNWCESDMDASHEFTPANFGTPKAANPACMNVVPGQCNDHGTMRATVAPQPGDLTITEVMPNPGAVSDTTGEWFEVLANSDVDLNGVGLDRASDTSNPVVLSSADCLHATAGTRLVFARSTDMVMNGGLPRVDGTFNFSLISGSVASPGDVQLVMGATVLDSVTWTSSREGKSIQLDPQFSAPADNDDPANLCDATMTYGAGDLGTPGAANTSCGTVSSGMCLDTGTNMMRPEVTPVVGDLTITEVMPSPGAVGDNVGEWFEVLVNRDLDLNDLGLDRASDAAMPNVITSATCKPVTAGSYLIFARSNDMTMNGMLPHVDGTFTFTLVGGSAAAPGDVRLMQGANVLDSVSWTSSRSGKSLQLDAAFTSPADNDVAGNFCDGATAYGAGDLGTPGAANAMCMMQTTGMCMDTGTMQLRPIVKPMAGQLAIDEWMPDSKMVADTLGEWFEVTATADVDLNGLQVGTTTLGTTPFIPASGPCVHVAAGGYALFAHNASAAENGGLMNVDATFGNALTQSNGQLRIGIDNAVLSMVSWASSVAGKAIMLDSDGTQCNAPAGVPSYNGGMDFGTPRAVNTPPECP